MTRRSKKQPNKSSETEFTLGRSAIRKLNSIAGLEASPASQARFDEFDRLGLSAEARRAAIVAAHQRKLRAAIAEGLASGPDEVLDIEQVKAEARRRQRAGE